MILFLITLKWPRIAQCSTNAMGWMGSRRRRSIPLMKKKGYSTVNASLYAEGRSNTGKDELEEEDELDEGVLGKVQTHA